MVHGTPNPKDLLLLAKNMIPLEMFWLILSGCTISEKKCELDGKVSLPDGASLEHLIQCRIPHRLTIPKKVSGQKIGDYLTSSWGFVKYVLRHSSLKRQEEHDISRYIQIMEMVEKACTGEIFEGVRSKKGNGKTIKLKGSAGRRKFMEDGGSKPEASFKRCACCGHILVDEPKENKKIKRSNEKLSKKWAANKKIYKDWTDGNGPPLVVDGKVVKDFKNPKYEDELLVCHCYQNHHSVVKGGTKCILECYDANTKKQYKAGTCPACKCSCAFVCTKM